MSVNANLDLILRRYDELGARLSEGVSGAEYSALSKEYAELESIAASIRNLRAKEKERGDLELMLADPTLDAEMRGMAEMELESATQEVARLTQEIRISLLPKDAADEGNVILEVRAGTGGDEAALFAGDLFRMSRARAGRSTFCR